MKHTFGFFIGHLPKTFKKYLIIIKQQKSKQFSRLRAGQTTIEYFLVFVAFAAVTFLALSVFFHSELKTGILEDFFQDTVRVIRR